MRRFRAFGAMVGLIVALCGIAYADNVAGTWTKTNHPDPDNIVVLYTEAQVVKAVGYEQVGGVPAYWYGEGTIRDGQLTLTYHYSSEATPLGWEPEGRMLLKLSEDGSTWSGTATSRSGNWSDNIVLRRIYLVLAH
jgi:hypothetical protein